MKAIQTCRACGKTEEGHTGPGDKYVCTECHKSGVRVDGFGNLSRDGHAGTPWGFTMLAKTEAK